MKWLTAICALCVLLLAGTAWSQLRVGDEVKVPVSATVTAASTAVEPADARRKALVAARRSCRSAELDSFLAEQKALVARSPSDTLARRLCAEALLERVLLQGQLRGMAIGEPIWRELPPAFQRDLDEAQELLLAARRLGDDTADNWRLEASVLGQRITGFGTALQWNGRIQTALATAASKDAGSPALHVALGLRQLLAPALLGHDPAKALEHLEFAARSMPDDERPRVFAAMAAFLLKKRQQAIAWLDQAVAQNPNNVFARTVLARLRTGEPEPFARDVTAAEAAANK